jgi:hypothetical protein
MALSEQFWLSVVIQIVFGVAIVAMMKQQLKDLVGWMRELQATLKSVLSYITEHEGRLSHVEGRLDIPRKAKTLD